MDNFSASELCSKWNAQFGSNRIIFEPLTNEIAAVTLANDFGTASVSVYGGHLLSYVPAGENPVIFRSTKSLYQNDSAIRGGVPVCWPWFSADPKKIHGAHGFARLSFWEVVDAGDTPMGESFLKLELTNKNIPASFEWPNFRLHLTVTLGKVLTVSLKIKNRSSEEMDYSGALHSYFVISDVDNVAVRGLDGTTYLNSLNGQECEQCGDIAIDQEVDRIYHSSAQVQILDRAWRRKILIAKAGSKNTVVWNPWIEKARRMADFGDEEYHNMLCIEAANTPRGGDARTLQPGATAELRQSFWVAPLADGE